MKIYTFTFKCLVTFAVAISTFSCSNDDSPVEPEIVIEPKETRPFNMGFTTWSYGAKAEDVEGTYSFIFNNADIYSEQFDHRIPWSAWMNNSELPKEFVDNVNYRLSKRNLAKKLLLSVSLLNIGRDDLLEDYDNQSPSYVSMSDTAIENSYIEHLTYLINRFNPNYLVMAMEVNEMRVKKPEKWAEYMVLASNIKARLKVLYPQLPVSESVTLHNWCNYYGTLDAGYVDEITNYVNALDFAAISFYPFLMGLHTEAEFQAAFDFLNSKATKPIAFVETGENAEDIDIPAFDFKSAGDEAKQKLYLETLLGNCLTQNYLFCIWWCHRDYDQMLNDLPSDLIDLALLWRDIGLIDEEGNKREAFDLWSGELQIPYYR